MNDHLLPFQWKWIGCLLLLGGLTGLVFYIWFDFQLMIPVFAIVSSFFETKTFSVIRTNAADELILLSFLSGFFFLAFSKEKTESENLKKLRERAWGVAFRINTILLFLSVIFFYGGGFLAILVFNLFSLFVFYLVIFHVSRYRKRDRVAEYGKI